jgi:hypothetical protein
MSLRLKRRFIVYVVIACCCSLFPANLSLAADDKDKKSLNEKVKEIAGTAEFLRSVPKFFATLKAADPAQLQITLLVDGESLPKVWRVAADAEIKRAGWWGRLNQFTIGDRVWVWFETDRHKQPVAVSMLADELSEQEMHAKGVTLEAVQGEKITLKPATGKSRMVSTSKAEVLRGKEKVSLDKLKVGEKIFVQSSGNQARLILDPAAFEELRNKQKDDLRKLWMDQGLPGSVVFLHRFSGEMDFMLDHEAIRWARSLKPGDKVTLKSVMPITAVVKQVQPWRERTQLRLVVAAADQGDLALGQRVFLQMPPPSAEVDNALLPDLDRPRTKPERIEWFLASIYCTCGVKADTCTGHFYTLASCNPNGCGMPNQMRKVLAEKIDKGLTDKQILDELLKESGPDLLRQHLLP